MRPVRYQHPTAGRVETFRPILGDLAFGGYADTDGQVVFYRTPTRKHTTDTLFEDRFWPLLLGKGNDKGIGRCWMPIGYAGGRNFLGAGPDGLVLSRLRMR